jgi:hypothetical protein
MIRYQLKNGMIVEPHDGDPFPGAFKVIQNTTLIDRPFFKKGKIFHMRPDGKTLSGEPFFIWDGSPEFFVARILSE